MNVGKVVSDLRKMTTAELRRTYGEVFGEQTRSHHKEYLIRRIAWRMQANAEGGLPERARRRALELADDADLRMKAPATTAAASALERIPSGGNGATMNVSTDERLPMPGAVLSREYKGRTINVRVLEKGFEYEGDVYRSLSAVAQAATGSHWNGYLFFGLEQPKEKR